MQFMILRRADQETEAGTLPSGELCSAMGKYNQQLVDAGVMQAGVGLKPSAEGVRVRIAPGEVTVTDGPFAETKELVAGFSLFDLPSKDDAIAWLRRWPALDGGGTVELEVREAGCPGGCAEVVGAEDSQCVTGTAAAGQARAVPAGRRYVILLRSDRGTEEEDIPPRHMLDELDRFNAAEAAAGILLAGQGLQSSGRGARIKFNGGKPSVVDGPFTEVKELIAGFWMIRAHSMKEAIEWAVRCPYPTGPQVELEIRPTWEIDDFGAAGTEDLRAAEQRMRA